MRTRRLAVAAIVFAALFLVAVLLVRSDLAFLRTPATWITSRLLDAPVTLGTPFSLDLGATTRIELHDLRIGPKGSQPGGTTLRIGDLVAEVRLASLVRGPADFPLLRLRNVRLDLPAKTRQESTRRRKAPNLSGLPRFRDVEAESIRIVQHEAHLDARIERVQIMEDENGILHVDLSGRGLGTPLELEGRIGPFANLVSGEATHQDLRLRLGSIRGRLHGETVSLSTLVGARLELDVEGRDLADAGRLLAATGLLDEDESIPDGPFALHAAVQPGAKAGRLAVKARAEAASLSVVVTGTVTPGLPPAMELSCRASGPDAGVLVPALRRDGIPRLPFSLTGAVRSRGFPLHLKRTRLTLGGILLEVAGTVGAPPALDGTALDLDLEIPASAQATLVSLLGRPLPPGVIQGNGRIELTRRAIDLDGIELTAGAIRMAVRGRLPRPGSRLPRRSALDLEASGPDLSVLSGLVGGSLPALPFALTTRLVPGRGRIAIRSLSGTLGPDRLTASGTLRTGTWLEGTELQATAEGPDPGTLGGLIGLPGLPSGRYRASAAIRLAQRELTLHPLEGDIAGHEIRGAVRIRWTDGPPAVTLRIDAASGPDASALATITGLAGLPPAPYSVTGTVTTAPDTVTLHDLDATVGGTHVRIHGGTIEKTGARALDLDLEGSGDDLSLIGRIIGLSGLPPVSWKLGGHVGRESGRGVVLEPLAGTIAGTTLSIKGSVQPPATKGWRMVLDATAHGDDPSTLLRVLTGIGVPGLPENLPRKPFSLSGRFGHGPGGVTFRKTRLRLGSLTVEADGTLDRPSQRAGTALRVHVEAPGTLPITALPGTSITGLEARLGIRSRDTGGGAPLGVTGSVSARRLTMKMAASSTPQPETPAAGRANASAGAPLATEEAAREKGDDHLVIPDRPLDFRPATAADLDLRIGIESLETSFVTLTDLGATLRWTRHELAIDGLHAREAAGGTLEGNLQLLAGDGEDRVHVDLHAESIPVDLSPGSIPGQQLPRLDLRAELEGTGRTLHAVAAHATGRASLSTTPGLVPAGILDIIGDSVFLQLFNALNPFRKAESTTELECLAVVAQIDDGRIELDPMALKTSRVLTLGSGTIDLETEKIDIAFQSKSRRGLGLSASTVTDAFIKLGGTLAKPAMKLRPLRATASTGLAVVTGGLSILAKGLWNRVTSESDVCSAMDKTIADLWTPPSPEPPKNDAPTPQAP